MDKFDSALYCGAGVDVNFIKHLPNIDHFIHIDPLPHTEAPLVNGNPFLTPAIHHPEFISELDQKLIDIGYDFVSEMDYDHHTSRHYMDSGRKILLHYFISTALNCTHDKFNIAPEIKYEAVKWQLHCYSYNILIVAGYIPHVKVLEFSRGPLRFIGNTTTVYKDEFHDEDSITTHLHDDPNTQKKFKSFEMMELDGSLTKFDTWQKFYTYSEKN